MASAGKPYADTFRRIAFDDDDVVEQGRIGRWQRPQPQARVEETAADPQPLRRRGDPVRVRIEVLDAVQDVAEQAGGPVWIFRLRLAQSVDHLPVPHIDVGGAVAEPAVLRVTFGQVSLGALVLVEVARDDRIEDVARHEWKRVARDPLVDLLKAIPAKGRSRPGCPRRSPRCRERQAPASLRHVSTSNPFPSSCPSRLGLPNH